MGYNLELAPKSTKAKVTSILLADCATTNSLKWKVICFFKKTAWDLIEGPIAILDDKLWRAYKIPAKTFKLVTTTAKKYLSDAGNFCEVF